MKLRRIVTGHSPDGKSIFVSDGAPPRAADFQHVPGMSAALLWETPPAAQVPHRAGDPTPATTSWVPAAGGTNVMVVVLPPDSVMAGPTFDPVAAGGEYMQHLPGLAEKFEMDAPGMHTSDTVDYGVVLEGEVDLELDEGQIRSLRQHDVVVQNGTRHAWRNKSSKPVTMLFILVGARRAD